MSEMKTCAGCGKERPWSNSQYEASELVEIEVAVHADPVLVCQGRGKGGASDTCSQKARQERCPGCGGGTGYVSGVHAPAMCQSCRADLYRGEEAREATAKAGLALSLIRSGEKFLNAYVWRGGSRDLGRQIAETLARVAGGRLGDVGHDPTHGYVPPRGERESAYDMQCVVGVEVTTDQHEALSELAKLLTEVVDIVRREAFQEGNDLLGKLARNEIGTGPYDAEAERRGPKRGEE